MALVAIRLLIINSDLDFAISIKQALEQLGDYEAASFTTAEAAFEQLQNRPYNVALVDFTMSDLPGMDIVLRLRAIQADIGIIACPNLPDIVAVVNDMNLNGIVDIPCTARDLIPVIFDAIKQISDALPDTAEAPALVADTETLVIDPPPEEAKEFESLDNVLIRMGGMDITMGSETIDVDMSDAEYVAQDDKPKTIEFVLTGELSALKDESDKSPEEGSVAEEADGAVDIFQRLLDEEPPPLEDSGSVGDLRAEVEDSNIQHVADVLRKGQAQTQATPEKDEKIIEDSPAQVILETALDETSPNEFSLEELLRNIVRRFPEDAGGVKPLPSWEEEVNRYVTEPDFLVDNLPELEQTDKSNIQTTIMGDISAVEAHSGDMETDLIPEEMLDREKMQDEPQGEPQLDEDDPLDKYLDEYKEEAQTQPDTDDLPDEHEEPAEVVVAAVEEEETAVPGRTISPKPAEESTIAAVIAAIKSLKSDDEQEPETYETSSEPIAAVVTEADEIQTIKDEIFGSDSAPIVETQRTPQQDTRITQLALGLTQASLESTAEATLLARDGRIVTHSGTLSLEDIEKLCQSIQGDLEARPNEARIRFVTLPDSGQDYMLYSRRTEGGYTLTMIFAGNMPLRVIRRQSDRLVGAIRSVPEAQAETQESLPDDVEGREELQLLEEQATHAEEVAQESQEILINEQADDDEDVELVPYTYLWLVRDGDNPLTDFVADEIVTELDLELYDMGWRVDQLKITGDYVYLLANVPVNESAQELVLDLKQIAAEMAQKADNTLNPDTLWADSYAVLSPGREMDTEEIQRYIDFGRQN